MDYIPLLALGILFIVLGYFNFKGNISSIHWYNRRKALSSVSASCCMARSNTTTVFFNYIPLIDKGN